MIEVLLDFAHKAGKIMKKNIYEVQPLYNKDATVDSIVTPIDIKVSDLFARMIKKNFAQLNYMIIDEEKISQYGNNVFKAINNSEYQFVIDPVDGTLLYANGHPLYGITIGVYHNTKPMLGIIYMPAVGELVYCDGRKSYYVQNAFGKKAITTELKVQKTSSSPIAFCALQRWRLKDCSMSKIMFLNYFSAVSQTMYPLIGKAKSCCVTGSYMWDIAGVVPLAECLGMHIMEYESGKIYNRISDEFFDEKLRVKKPCVLCYPQDFDEICSMIEPLKR